MEFKFILYLGIIFAIFGFLWSVIRFGLMIFRAGKKKSLFEQYLVRLINYFLLTSITARFIMETGGGELNEASSVYAIVGGLILGAYLIGRFQRRKNIHELSKKLGGLMQNFTNNHDQRMEVFLLAFGFVYFIICLVVPKLIYNGVTTWFYDTIISIYKTPIIGWIFAIVGIFVVVNLVFRMIIIIRGMMGYKSNMASNSSFSTQSGGFPFGNNQPQQEETEEFSDFEDVTEDDSK